MLDYAHSPLLDYFYCSGSGPGVTTGGVSRDTLFVLNYIYCLYLEEVRGAHFIFFSSFLFPPTLDVRKL
jgi:hypothetical protein